MLILGLSWNGCYGLNYGLLFVPPYYLYNVRSPLSHLLGETVNFLLLGGIHLFFSTGFLCFADDLQSQHGVSVLHGRVNSSVVQQTMGHAGLSHQGTEEEAAAGCGAPDIAPVLYGLPLLPFECFQCQNENSEDAGILLHRF